MINFSIKSVFIHFLEKLEALVEKVPEDVFSQALHQDMFCLAIQARIATNFALRGYCPLADKEVINFDQPEQDKAAVLGQIRQTILYLRGLPEVSHLDEETKHNEKAGFNNVTLPQPAFIHQYILPNFYFHISMVYAIARSSGVKISKADFDGLHQYPAEFSFLDKSSAD